MAACLRCRHVVSHSLCCCKPADKSRGGQTKVPWTPAEALGRLELQDASALHAGAAPPIFKHITRYWIFQSGCRVTPWASMRVIQLLWHACICMTEVWEVATHPKPQPCCPHQHSRPSHQNFSSPVQNTFSGLAQWPNAYFGQHCSETLGIGVQ